ncbi:YfcE family phosphodiesterase [Staphylococcus sp. 17KM0847]|uniref:YfcE family phosphodiesterase n=1 Tax=Staphylococcus sp. 17KM0847 TaxID=2583989 RepID=UPI0015DC9FA5|nr:YfcE family phosphodiesterase [Staphylococcus sp. 17KM0847]QLK85784.1 YfcE family phosphodiesterase [Staphylococcus sp. 17KM0847]
MKKFIIVSDNHSEAGILYDVYTQHNDADAFFHLGDSEFEYHDTELSLYQRVKGNMDFYPEFLESDIAHFDDIHIFFTHGHLFGVNTSRAELVNQALHHGAQIALYGHTHIAKYEKIKGVHVINPGSISQSRSNLEETYAELKLGEENVIHFRNRNHQIIQSIIIDE